MLDFVTINVDGGLENHSARLQRLYRVPLSGRNLQYRTIAANLHKNFFGKITTLIVKKLLNPSAYNYYSLGRRTMTMPMKSSTAHLKSLKKSSRPSSNAKTSHVLKRNINHHQATGNRRPLIEI